MELGLAGEVGYYPLHVMIDMHAHSCRPVLDASVDAGETWRAVELERVFVQS
jgi:hypothetical protein